VTETNGWTPPAVWVWDKASGGRFARINRPVAGATHDRALPVGRHPLQLYSQATPNGVKVTILLEELLALGHAGAANEVLPERHAAADIDRVLAAGA
jgi:GST-like protein